MALFSQRQRLHLCPAAPTRKRQNPREISTWVRHFLSADILWAMVYLGTWMRSPRWCTAEVGRLCWAMVFGGASFSCSSCPLAWTVPFHRHASVFHPRRCAEDFLPICSPTHWASTPSQGSPPRCPGPMNQRKSSHTLEKRGLRIQREEAEGTGLKPADGLIGGHISTPTFFPDAGVHSPNPLLHVRCPS